MILSDLLHFFGIAVPSGDVWSLKKQEIFSGVFSIDTRQLVPGSVFVAIAGERFDGHDFVEEAFKKGIYAAIVSKSFVASEKGKDLINRYGRLIPVGDTQQALHDLAGWYRLSLHIPAAALTGSCGKTSTKEMIAAILREHYQQVFVTPGNKNNHLGVPLTILQCSPQDEVAVFELGANHVGEIRHNVHLVKPKVALITNVGSAHIGEFGSVENIFKAKSEIFEGLTTDGLAIYNADDAFANAWKEVLNKQHTCTFGLNSSADIQAQMIHYDPMMCATFQLKTPQGSIEVTLSVPGEHNVMNALAAAALSLALDVTLEQIAVGLKNYKGFSGRMFARLGIQGSRIIDDTYNANLKSVEAAMSVLAGISGKRFFVLGDLGELGDWETDHYRAIGKKANELKLDGLFTCGLNSYHAGELFQGLTEHFDNQLMLIEKLKTYLDPQTTVVVKGSRSSHMEDVVSAITILQ